MSLQTTSKLLLRRNVPLSQYTTMQVGGAAAYFAEPTTESQLKEALKFARERSLPVLVIGKGANTIFSDEGYPGLVITFIHYEKDRICFDSKEPLVTVACGVSLHRVAVAARDRALSGLEFLASIPGTVGGALCMNAGFGRAGVKVREIKDVIKTVTVLSLSGEREIWDKSKLQFSYRNSNLKNQIILEGQFVLKPGIRDDIEQEIKANFEYRSKEQDMNHPSSGSIFKNPSASQKTAGRLIDEQGLKGVREGGIMVSLKHGNYFINVGGGSSRDVHVLIEKVQAPVRNATGILLEPEVCIIEKK